ncbi:MAG: hypothetical protein H6662_00810 [Ardenticatenaceae bacterium]|nr:hypothetical protein [Anaerolineales bacterium]MCB8920098.1 hypothetical protein [Ardenticatenaceae bacterium]MCB8991791.1 hypothetical protein [Ardenticatenaceae bacterium]
MRKAKWLLVPFSGDKTKSPVAVTIECGLFVKIEPHGDNGQIGNGRFPTIIFKGQTTWKYKPINHINW